MFNCHTIILFLWLLMTPSDCTVRQWWGVSMVKWCLTFDSFQRQWILAIISRSCLRVAKKFPAHVGAEMKQKKHYADIIMIGCQFITHSDNLSHPETIQLI